MTALTHVEGKDAKAHVDTVSGQYIVQTYVRKKAAFTISWAPQMSAEHMSIGNGALKIVAVCMYGSL
ncbi:MAG: hypothetical protein QXU93_00190 [Thermoproteus sp.]